MAAIPRTSTCVHCLPCTPLCERSCHLPPSYLPPHGPAASSATWPHSVVVHAHACMQNIVTAGPDGIFVLHPEAHGAEACPAPFKQSAGFKSYTTARWIDSQQFVTVSCPPFVHTAGERWSVEPLHRALTPCVPGSAVYGVQCSSTPLPPLALQRALPGVGSSEPEPASRTAAPHVCGWPCMGGPHCTRAWVCAACTHTSGAWRVCALRCAAERSLRRPGAVGPTAGAHAQQQQRKGVGPHRPGRRRAVRHAWPRTHSNPLAYMCPMWQLAA